MPKILVVGSINQDIVINTNSIPRPGETVEGDSINYFGGGKGANQAIAAKIHFEETYFVGKIGNDAFGSSLHAHMDKTELSQNIVQSNQSTGVATIYVDRKGENSIVVVPGANGSLTFSDCGLLKELIAGDFIILQNEIPQKANEEIIDYAYKNGIYVIYNPAPSRDFNKDILKAIKYLVVNETEFSDLFGEHPGDKNKHITKDMEEKYGCSIIVTLGNKGVISYHEKQYYQIQVSKVNVKDTTGAGDCFVGTFAATLAKGEGYKKTLIYATTAASLSVTKKGANISYFSTEEINQFLEG